MRVLLLIAAVLALLACPAPQKGCRPDTCASGCCSADDVCVMPSEVACGVGGASCAPCADGQTCSMGECRRPDPVDAGVPGLRLRYRNRFGWDGDGGTTAAVFPTASVGVWVRRPNGFVLQPGTVDEDGLISVSDVPAGPQVVQLGDDTFLVTSQRDVTFDRFVGGRKGAFAADASVPVTLSVQNLVPADAGHRIRVFFTQDTEAIALEARATPPLNTGTTTFSAMVDWSPAGGLGRATLPQAALGDQGWFLQLLERSLDGGLSERQLVAAAPFSPVTFSAGDAGALTASLVAAPVDSIPLDVDTLALRALLTQLGRTPVANSGQFLVALVVMPGPTPAALSPLTTHVLRVPETRPLPATLEAGAPFPSAWQTLLDFRYQVSFSRRSGARSVTFNAGTRVIDRLSALRGTRWVPVLSPPRDVSIGGRRVEFDTPSISVTPSVTWTAPSLGTASVYRLTWYPLVADAPPKVFWTSETRLDVPPQILSASEVYVLEVAAVKTGDGQPGAALPLQEATFVSGVLTP